MKVGMTLFFQNYLDWERYAAGRWDTPPQISDSAIYDEELPLGDLAEPLGFDSIWTVEHHHTPYTMIPNPTQLLSYYAGRTTRVDMGPWSWCCLGIIRSTWLRTEPPYRKGKWS